MIIQRYLQREIVTTFVGVAVLLSLIFLSGTFVRILSAAAEGTYPAGLVLKLFALKGIGNLVFILPLAFFIGVLLALGRFYRDSEMTVLAACGVGPEYTYRVIGRLALLVAALLAVLALYFAPWSEELSYRLLDEAGARPELEGLAEGRFNKVGAEGQLVYVETVADNHQRLTNVFAYGDVNGVRQVLTAERAYQRTDPQTGERYLVLLDGHRYEGTPGTPDFKIIAFGENGMRLVEREVVASERSRHAISSLDLWRNGDTGDIAELQWRIAVPITTLLLALVAVPLSKSSPREGRYGRLFLGIVVYIVYNNMLSVARAALAKGESNAWFGLWWVHLLALLVLLVVIAYQKRLHAPWRWRRAAA